jgi:hypothetical protein
MTRRAEPVAVDWLWRGRHLDLETGSLVRRPTLKPGPGGRRRYLSMHERSKRRRQQQVTAVQEFQIANQGRQQDDRYSCSAGPSAKAAAAVGCWLSAEAPRLRPRGGTRGRWRRRGCGRAAARAVDGGAEAAAARRRARYMAIYRT